MNFSFCWDICNDYECNDIVILTNQKHIVFEEATAQENSSESFE